MSLLLCFNSTLVRLEDLRHFALHVQAPLFQFHFGSIGSITDPNGIIQVIKAFQFHFGSIGSKLYTYS